MQLNNYAITAIIAVLIWAATATHAQTPAASPTPTPQPAATPKLTEAEQQRFNEVVANFRKLQEERFALQREGTRASVRLALDKLRAALELMKNIGVELGGKSPSVKSVSDEVLAIGLVGLGQLHKFLGEFSEAGSCFQRAVALTRQLKNGKTVSVTKENLWGSELNALVEFGDVYISSGRFQEAIGVFEEAMKAVSQAQGKYPGNKQFINFTAISLVGIGGIYLSNLQEPDKTIEYYSRARDVYLQMSDAKSAASMLRGIGASHLRMGFYDRALALDFGGNR